MCCRCTQKAQDTPTYRAPLGEGDTHHPQGPVVGRCPHPRGSKQAARWSCLANLPLCPNQGRLGVLKRPLPMGAPHLSIQTSSHPLVMSTVIHIQTLIPWKLSTVGWVSPPVRGDCVRHRSSSVGTDKRTREDSELAHRRCSVNAG